MPSMTEELWSWLWSYRDWLIGITRSDYRNIVHGDEILAGDLADDVLFRAASNIQSLRDRRKVKSWLRTILRNMALDRRREEQAEGQSFARWLSAVQEGDEGNDSYRYFAFLSLLEIGATKAEQAYIGSLKQDAEAKKVVNVPKNRAVQLLKKRLHSQGAEYSAEQIKQALQASQMMAEMEGVAKQITADIAVEFKKTVRSIEVSDEIVWEWCCALVIAAMRSGLAEANRDTSDSPAVDKAVHDIFSEVLQTVLLQAVANIPPPTRKQSDNEDNLRD